MTAIQNICMRHVGCYFRLTVQAQPCDVAVMEAFWGQFPNICKQRINLVWQPYRDTNEELVEKDDDTSAIPLLGNAESVEKNSEIWQLQLPPRLQQAILYPNGSAYMFIPCNPDKDEPAGVLSESDIAIRWNEPIREMHLSHYWFDNYECSECKHLPLLVRICPKIRMQNGVFCPVNSRLVTPDSLIVKEFESKQ